MSNHTLVSEKIVSQTTLDGFKNLIDDESENAHLVLIDDQTDQSHRLEDRWTRVFTVDATNFK